MIYFIQDSSTHFIKIGHTDGEAAERLKALQTGCPSGLVLLSTQPGAKDDERGLHQRFAAHRERGEWFRPAPELVRHVISGAAEVGYTAGAQSFAPENVRPLPGAWPLRVYLAGKIAKNCWRHQIVSGLSSAMDEYATSCPSGGDGEVLPHEWPILEGSILDTHHYTGPYFFGDDHGCWHGDDSHGVDAQASDMDCHGNSQLDRPEKVVGLCLRAIERSDLVYGWISSPDCYGTIAELGYAAALGKHIWLAGPRRFRDMWFVYKLDVGGRACSSWYGGGPKEILATWLDEYRESVGAHIPLTREGG